MTQNPNKIEIQPVMDALEIIGGKWRFPLLYILCGGKKRFSELQRELPKITPKVLSFHLKELETNELIERKVISTAPVTVEYELTEYGKTLEPVLRRVQDWGKKHRQRILKNFGNAIG